MFKPSEQSEASGVRAFLERHRVSVVAAAAVVIVIALVMQLRRGDPAEQGGYYSADDGKTFFESARKVPPFDHHGTQAVGAVVYSCDGGKTKTVAYLQKFTAEGKQKVEENDRSKRGGAAKGLLLKKPGAPEWTAADDPANARKIAEIRAVHCPNGGTPMMYLPE